MSTLASRPSATFAPPCYAVIFTSRRAVEHEGYDRMAARMEELARRQPGFLGIESVRQGDLGITVSYWSSLEDIDRWRANAEHRVAQRLGREKWYDRYEIRVARVERAASFVREGRDGGRPG